jgi:hypothetical protein
MVAEVGSRRRPDDLTGRLAHAPRVVDGPIGIDGAAAHSLVRTDTW